MKSAIIVGGGLAGLTAGFVLHQSGWQVTLLEAAAYPGGRAAGFDRKGYGIDTGATQISSGYREYLKLCRETGIDGDVIESSHVVGIVRDGLIHEIDGSSMLSGPFSTVLSWQSKFKMVNTALDYIRLRPRMDVLDVSRCCAYDTETAAEYCERRLNREIYDYLVDPLIRGYVMHRADGISALEWFSSLGNLAGQKMLAVRGGSQRLPHELASRLNTRLNARVRQVRRNATGVEVDWNDGEGNSLNEQADACVIATRLPEALEIYPEYAEIAGSLASRITYNTGLCIHLGYRRQTACKAVGVLISTREHDQVGLVWLEHNKAPDRAPTGHSLLTCYFDSAAPGDCFHQPDEQLIRTADAYLQKLFPELQGQLDFTHVSRWPLAIVNPAVGIYREVHRLKQSIDPNSQIQYAGDYFTCTGQNSAIHYGHVAANNLLAANP